MSSSSELIKERLGIADVVGSYIKIEKAGANYKARCPFHHEKTPSFMVSPGRNSYYCFGCGAKGDIFSFVQEFEKVDFIGALKILAEKAGVELTQYKANDALKSEMDRLRLVLERATLFYEGELKKNTEVNKYLTDRGLTEKTIKEWRIGWAPNEWRNLFEVMDSGGVSVEDMEKVGLVKQSDKEKEAMENVKGGSKGTPDVDKSAIRADGKRTIYDRFRSRVMFPLFDPSGRVIGYSGRLFGLPEAEGAKYLNSPETVLFNKSETLYGYHKAKEGIREWKYSILVEGQMDLLMCHQFGYTNAVATSGTALTHQHLEKLKKISDNIMIVYDADKAGLKATLRAWTAALSLGMDVKIAPLPEGEDPASILLSNKDKFKEALKHSKHIIEYHLDMISREGLEERKLWHAVETEILPYVAALSSAIDKAHFIATISLNTGIPESDLREQLNKTKAVSVEAQTVSTDGRRSASQDDSRIADASKPAGMDHSNSYAVLERIAGIASWQKEKDADKAQRMITRMSSIIDQEEMKYFESLLDNEKTSALIFEAEMIYGESEHLDKDVDELFYELEERMLKERYKKMMNELHIAERKKEKEKAERLYAECQEISVKLSKLQKKKKESEK